MAHCAHSRLASYSHNTRTALVLRKRAAKTRAASKGFADGRTNTTPGEKAQTPSLGKLLNGCPLFFVGDDTEVNERVAEAFAEQLRGYTPLSTSKVVGEMNGVEDGDAVARDEGEDAAALAEAAVLETASTFVRTAVACRGGGGGAAARGACWRHIHGGIGVWLDGCDGKPQANRKVLPQDEAYSLAEVKVVFEACTDVEVTTQSIVPKVEEALIALMTNFEREAEKKGMPEGQRSLAAKKLLYVKLGARGDWPEIQPPEWQPE